MKQVCFELTLQGQISICSFIKMMLKGEAFQTEITKLILKLNCVRHFGAAVEIQV